MKTIIFIQVLLITLALASCSKEEGITPSCETVVNPNGPSFLKIINNRSDHIIVDLTSIIPLKADTRPGACEIFGLPDGGHIITIEKEDGSASREVNISLTTGNTHTVSVGVSFF